MNRYLQRAWAQVDLDRIGRNFQTLRAHVAPGCKIMAVVKADAYGHGDRAVATRLAREGADWFGVSNVEEALSLRRAGLDLPVLVFGATPVEYAGALIRNHITQTVFSIEYASALHQAVQGLGGTLDIHIKIDTGMTRMGFAPEAADAVAGTAALPCFRAGGIYTHFACADEKSPDAVGYTNRQFDRFTKLLEQLEAAGTRFAIRHCCNSAGAMEYPGMHLDMVRPGIMLYGLAPSADCAHTLPLLPAMSLLSRVAMVKEVPEGTPVSYGRRYITNGPTRLATVPIGYADGYTREQTNRGRMLVRGEEAPVAGRVCMDQLLLDVTHIPGVSEGDLVTVVGRDGSHCLTFDHMAGVSGTINYEKACLVGRRVPRVYLEGGAEVAVADYVGER